MLTISTPFYFFIFISCIGPAKLTARRGPREYAISWLATRGLAPTAALAASPTAPTTATSAPATPTLAAVGPAKTASFATVRNPSPTHQKNAAASHPTTATQYLIFRVPARKRAAACASRLPRQQLPQQQRGATASQTRQSAATCTQRICVSLTTLLVREQSQYVLGCAALA